MKRTPPRTPRKRGLSFRSFVAKANDQDEEYGQSGEFGQSGLRSDRLAVVLLAFVLLGLCLAFALRSITSRNTPRTASQKVFEEIVIRNKFRPEVIGFKRDPRSEIHLPPRIRKPGTSSQRARPLAQRGRRVLDSEAGKLDRAGGRPRAHPERVAWTPRPRTPIPAHAKYGEDVVPQRATPLLRVLSEPSGQPVEIDGVRFGATPVSRPVPSGVSSVEVRILGSGFREVQRRVAPDASGDFVLSVVLEPENTAR